MSEEVNTKKKSKFKKKTAAFAGIGAFLFALVAVSPTAANWNDAESSGANMQAGSFGLEISVDGGNSWQSNSGAATLALDSFDYWAPGDNDTAEFQLRVSPGSSHSGVLDFSCENINMTTSGSGADGFSWGIGEVATDGRIGAESLNNCSTNNLFGEAVIEDMNPGEEYTFTLTMDANSSLQQNTSAAAEWEFIAESTPNT